MLQINIQSWRLQFNGRIAHYIGERSHKSISKCRLVAGLNQKEYHRKLTPSSKLPQSFIPFHPLSSSFPPFPVIPAKAGTQNWTGCRIMPGMTFDMFNPRSNNVKWHQYCIFVDSFQKKYPQERGPLCNREEGVKHQKENHDGACKVPKRKTV